MRVSGERNTETAPVRAFREQEAAMQYCRRLYNETSAGQITETGAGFGSQNLWQAHSRLAAYAAVKTGNLGERMLDRRQHQSRQQRHG